MSICVRNSIYYFVILLYGRLTKIFYNAIMDIFYVITFLNTAAEDKNNQPCDTILGVYLFHRENLLLN